MPDIQDDEYVDWLHQKADELDDLMEAIGADLWEKKDWGSEEYEKYKNYKLHKAQRDAYLNCLIQYLKENNDKGRTEQV